MSAVWMIYASALGFLLGLVAHALERVASLWWWPRRYVWTVAILASLLVPLAVLMRPPVPPSLAPTPRVEPPRNAVASVAPVRGMSTGAGTVALSKVSVVLAGVNRPLLLLWCATSLVLVFRLLGSSIGLRRRARGWRAVVVDGTPVLVALDIGPAVVRLGGFTIVLPDWALSEEPLARSLMLEHEKEHCRARDPDLLLGATVALVLAPWNLPLWWLVHRLQLAVETDCDRRVMRAGAEAQAYGGLLLRVGARRTRQPLLAATAFAETSSLLERRILAMTTPRPKNPIVRAALATCIAALGVAIAGMMPQPRLAAPTRTNGEGLLARSSQQGTCTDTLGVLLSVRREAGAIAVADEDLLEVARSAVVRNGYAPLLDSVRAARASNRLDVSFRLQAGYFQAGTLVTRAGARPQYFSSAGSLSPGAGSATVGSMLGHAVQLALDSLPRGNCLWVGRRAGEQPTLAPRELPAGVYREEDVTERPERLGGPAPRYPDSLRAAGVGGRALVEFIVDTTGHVDTGSVRIISSTHPGFEAPTREAIIASAFRPGLLQGHAVRVLVQQPVNYQVAPELTHRLSASNPFQRDAAAALRAQDFARADSLLGLAQQGASGQELQTVMFYRGMAQMSRASVAVTDAESKARDAEKDPAVRTAACASVAAAGDFLNQAEPNLRGGAASNPDMANQLLTNIPQMRGSLPQLARALNCPS
jgi:TonB family protein